LLGWGICFSGNRQQLYNPAIRSDVQTDSPNPAFQGNGKDIPMKKMLVLFGVLMLALPLMAQMSDSKGGGVSAAITQMEQAWASNSKSGNLDAVAANLADNFVELNSDGKFSTKAQMLDRMKSSKWEVNEVSNIKVSVHGDTAIATGSWQGKGTSAGKSVDQHESWVDTWMKMANGKWQCIASASSPAKM
jgi:ketosteroid isomerase-like protein